MSNMLLRELLAAGVVSGQVLTFTQAHHAVDFAARCEPARVVMVVHGAGNAGCYWVVEPIDAVRLEAAGYFREEAWHPVPGRLPQ